MVVVPAMLLSILFVLLLLLALLLGIAAAALAIAMAVAVATAVALIARGLFSYNARPALATAARARAVLAMGKRRASSAGAAPGAPDDRVDLSERGRLPARLRAWRAQHPPRAYYVGAPLRRVSSMRGPPPEDASEQILGGVRARLRPDVESASLTVSAE